MNGLIRNLKLSSFFLNLLEWVIKEQVAIAACDCGDFALASVSIYFFEFIRIKFFISDNVLYRYIMSVILKFMSPN